MIFKLKIDVAPEAVSRVWSTPESTQSIGKGEKALFDFARRSCRTQDVPVSHGQQGSNVACPT